MQELRSSLYKMNAINLKSSKVGEADKIVIFFSKERGKIHAIAKGARKPKSKFGGRLEPFAYNHVVLAKGKELDIVTQVETIDNFYEIRNDQKKLSAGAYILRLVNASTEVGQKNEALFDLLYFVLNFIKADGGLNTAVKLFEAGLTHVEGYFPMLDRCVKCGKKVSKEPERVKFSVPLRGIVCSGCGKAVPGIDIPFKAASAMIFLKDRSHQNVLKLGLSKHEVEKIDLILKTLISDHIGRDVREWRK